MSMSKGDFVALAQALIEARNAHAPDNMRQFPQAARTLEIVAGKLADVCAKGNPRFDRERFLRAALQGDFSVPKGKARRERDARINAAVREVLK